MRTLELRGQIPSPISTPPLYVLCGFNSHQGSPIEYTQSGIGHFLVYLPSWWLVRVRGACPPPFTISTITYKVVVYAPAEMADTLPPISTLPLYLLCGFNSQQGLLTDYTEWQRPISGVHSIMREKLAQAGEGGG